MRRHHRLIYENSCSPPGCRGGTCARPSSYKRVPLGIRFEWKGAHRWRPYWPFPFSLVTRSCVCLFVMVCSAVLLAACARLSLQAVEIEPDEMCHHCKMAISERRFAAELLSRDGEVSKFDDIGCMIQYLEGRKDKDDFAACFVVDFHSREWVDAEQAYFVRSSALKTPMSGNFAAFKHMSRAEEAAAAYGGKLLRFAGLTGELHSGDSPNR